MKKISVYDKLKILFLTLYFILLTIERVISLVTFFTGDFSAYDALDWYMTILTICSIIGAYIIIFTKCPVKITHSNNEKALVSGLKEGIFGRYAFGAGILLLGGMVHTEGTISGIQFVSYGMILLSMAIHTIQQVKFHGEPLKRWLSFSFITAFSMSIPVVYHTDIELSWLFIPIEIVVSAGLVVIFTIALRKFYLDDAKYSFPIFPIAAAVIGDTAVIVIRWQEEINFFVLIFIVVTVMLWICEKIINLRKDV